MSDKKNDNRNQTTDNESRDQKTVGSNNNKPTTVNPDKQERVPNEKVPNIGDPKRKTSIEDDNTKKTNAIKDERNESRNEGRKETSEDKKNQPEQITNVDSAITNQHESHRKVNNR